MKILKIVFWFIVLIWSVWNLSHDGLSESVSLYDLISSTKRMNIVKSEEIKTDINNIDISWKSGVVNVFKTNSGSGIRIDQSTPGSLPPDKTMSVEVKGDSLLIKDNGDENNPGTLTRTLTGLGVNFGDSSMVNIYLPEKEYNDVKINCLSGIIRSDLKAKKFTSKLSSGKIEIRGEVSDADIDVNKGNLQIMEMYSDNLKLRVNSGKAIISYGDIKNLDLSATKSDVRMYLSLKLEKFRCNAVSGKVILTVRPGFLFALNENSNSAYIKREDFNSAYHYGKLMVYKNDNYQVPNGGKISIFDIATSDRGELIIKQGKNYFEK